MLAYSVTKMSSVLSWLASTMLSSADVNYLKDSFSFLQPACNNPHDKDDDYDESDGHHFDKLRANCMVKS